MYVCTVYKSSAVRTRLMPVGPTSCVFASSAHRIGTRNGPLPASPHYRLYSIRRNSGILLKATCSFTKIHSPIQKPLFFKINKLVMSLSERRFDSRSETVVEPCEMLPEQNRVYTSRVVPCVNVTSAENEKLLQSAKERETRWEHCCALGALRTRADRRIFPAPGHTLHTLPHPRLSLIVSHTDCVDSPPGFVSG